MLMIPTVLRGITPDELGESELPDDKFGGPPKVYSSSGEGGDGSQEEAEPLGREGANTNDGPIDVVGPDVEELLPEMPSELLDLMGLRGHLEEDAPVDDCAIPVDEDLVTAIADANG